MNTYHRTQALGEGSFGSVVTVYNDDGEEFALKLFEPDEEDDNDDETLELGALLEISILRLLRGANGHTNIVPLVDIQGNEGEDEDEGAGTGGCLGMAMPLYPLGNLNHAIEQKSWIQSKQAKICIAHGLLSAVHHLHRNGIMHRDIKSDNVVLAQDGPNRIKPVLIDFSLVKIVDGTLWGKPKSIFPALSAGQEDKEFTPFTSGIGTAMYMAPEVYENEPYGRIADIWSVGVILLEVLQKEIMPDVKTSQALALIEERVDTLPVDKPFPTLARNLLQRDPNHRWSSLKALEYMSQTFPECTDPPTANPTIRLKEALPFDNEEEEEENVAPPTAPRTPGKTPGKKKRETVFDRRLRKVQQLCREVGCEHPMSVHAAMCYCQQMLELDEDLDDLESSQSMLDCVLLACKVFGLEVIDLSSVADDFKSFANWDLDTYRDNESTLFLMLDYCLYPRELVDLDR